MKISQVEITNDNSVWVPFVLERLINRKLHYRMGVSGYNVLRVIKRFSFWNRIPFKTALELG